MCRRIKDDIFVLSTVRVLKALIVSIILITIVIIEYSL